MKLLVVLVLATSIVCKVSCGLQSKDDDCDDDIYDKYFHKKDSDHHHHYHPHHYHPHHYHPHHHHHLTSYLEHKLHHILGRGVRFVRRFLYALYWKLTPLLNFHTFNLCHDADDYKDEAKKYLQYHLHGHSKHLTGYVHHKMEHMKKVSAHFIKILDMKGLKAYLMYTTRLLRRHLLRTLEHLKIHKIYHIRMLKVKLLSSLEKFKKRLAYLHDKIEHDLDHKIHDILKKHPKHKKDCDDDHYDDDHHHHYYHHQYDHHDDHDHHHDHHHHHHDDQHHHDHHDLFKCLFFKKSKKLGY